MILLLVAIYSLACKTRWNLLTYNFLTSMEIELCFGPRSCHWRRKFGQFGLVNFEILLLFTTFVDKIFFHILWVRLGCLSILINYLFQSTGWTFSYSYFLTQVWFWCIFQVVALLFLVTMSFLNSSWSCGVHHLNDIATF